jgi:hypothetical protein
MVILRLNTPKWTSRLHITMPQPIPASGRLTLALTTVRDGPSPGAHPQEPRPLEDTGGAAAGF